MIRACFVILAVLALVTWSVVPLVLGVLALYVGFEWGATK